MKTPATAIALVIALASAQGTAAVDQDFQSADRDGSRDVSKAEFAAASQDLRSDWDANNDDAVDEREYQAGLFKAWDRDGDGGISRFEYDEAKRNWARDKTLAPFGELDADNDKVLSRAELSNGLTQGNFYEAWDTDGDGTVDNDEFDAALFATWDADRSGSIDQSEYDGMAGKADAGKAAKAAQAKIVALSDWDNEDLYRGGLSVDDLIGEDVYGASGDDIGDVEDVLFGSDGRAIAIVAEVGGFLNIGDTHVSVPWDEVTMRADDEGVDVPLNEDNIENYGLFSRDAVSQKTAADNIVAGVDDATVQRSWRATELIGDYARLRDGETYSNYGYVDDLIVKDGKLAATVVTPDVRYGLQGSYAYPYYGYGYGFGWEPGGEFYDIPYDRDEVAEIEPFDYDSL
ncbi:MAG: hypothetical protein CMM50_00715 [Rhodospirillaceae bacterium]|mgnify:CR=1 FL=1|nr:hypothetical protein [Rhodospirillaceae bacterium]